MSSSTKQTKEVTKHPNKPDRLSTLRFLRWCTSGFQKWWVMGFCLLEKFFTRNGMCLQTWGRWSDMGKPLHQMHLSSSYQCDWCVWEHGVKWWGWCWWWHSSCKGNSQISNSNILTLRLMRHFAISRTFTPPLIPIGFLLDSYIPHGFPVHSTHSYVFPGVPVES